MRIGIDISQIVYEGSGVATYVRELVLALLNLDDKNEYVLFGSSFRQRPKIIKYFNELKSDHGKVSLVVLPLPPKLLDIFWNRLHIFPAEWFTGPLDIFWSSDWTQPPLGKAKGVTTIHDLIVLKYPKETDSRIVAVHKRRLQRVIKECQQIFCDSEATKKDILELLGVPEERLTVIYPGI